MTTLDPPAALLAALDDGDDSALPILADWLEEQGRWEEAAHLRLYHPGSGHDWHPVPPAQVWGLPDGLSVQLADARQGYWGWCQKKGWTFIPFLPADGPRQSMPCPVEVRRVVEAACHKVMVRYLILRG